MSCRVTTKSLRAALRGLGLAVALVATSSTAAAQAAPTLPPELVAAVDARVSARKLPAGTREAALAALSDAARRGVPLSPVADKVLEGLAKGIPPARLAPAAAEVATRLERSARALGPAAVRRDTLVIEGAEALRRGAAPEALEAVAAGKAEPAQLELAVRELGQLGAKGHATVEAGAALGALASRGYPATAIDSVSTQLDELLAESGEPRELFEEVAARAGAGRPIERLVDPFSDRPGAVVHDPAARSDAADLAPGASGLAPALGREHGRKVSPLDRPGAAGSVNPGDDEALKRRRDKKSTKPTR